MRYVNIAGWVFLGLCIAGLMYGLTSCASREDAYWKQVGQAVKEIETDGN